MGDGADLLDDMLFNEDRDDTMMTEAIVFIFKHETDAAILVMTTDLADVWLPKSQIEYPDHKVLKPGDQIDVTMAQWLAEEKELI